MNDMQRIKVINVTPPAAKVDDASFTTTEVDTIGWDYCTILVILGDTDIAMAALKVTHSTTSGSGHVDITGADFDGGTDIAGATTALPSADDDNKVFVMGIDLRSKNRFIDVVATAGNGSTGTFATILCILSKPEQAPTTVAGMGAGSVIHVD